MAHKIVTTIQHSVDERFRQMLVDDYGCKEEALTDKAQFVRDLGLDSLDAIELLLAVEERFDCEGISDEEAEKIVTIKDAVELIWRKLQ